MNHADLIQWIHQSRPWDDRLAESLKPFGFAVPKQAWQNLITLAGQANFPDLFPQFFATLLELLAKSYNADIALNNLERFSGKIVDKNYLYTLLSESPEFLRALVILFSGSQVLSDSLMSEPSYFDWLKRPETLTRSKSKDALMRDFYEIAGSDRLPKNTPSLLRKFKKREYIRIGLRDLLGGVEMRETVLDLSNLADVCLQVAYEYTDRQCRQKYGVPFYEDADGNLQEAEFAILGMGKLGGRELNYSSDIDLIYIYTSSRGETRAREGASIISVSNHEYFAKVAQGITKIINEITAEGNVFRVDLDLRPEGKSGEIVNSLASCEIYYQSWGRTWERQALLKARVSAGSEALGQEFLTMLEPFVYRRSLDFSAIEEIKAMKNKINESLKRKKTGKGHIKLGFGGIREIEFIVQSYQLIFGGRDKSLRVANTLELLDRLREMEFVKPDDYERLRDAYIFLRNLENRVQISFGLQTHAIPDQEAQRVSLARKMGIEGTTQAELAARIMEEFDRQTLFVGNMFAGLFEEDKKREAAEISAQQADRKRIIPGTFSLQQLKQVSFSDPERALRFLESLRDGTGFPGPSEKSIQAFYSVLPKILEFCGKVPRPNSAVENLVKFVEASGARETYLGLLERDEKLLELLMVLFGSSDTLSQTLIKQPALVDLFMDLESIYRFKAPAKIAEELNRGLQHCRDLNSQMLLLRRTRQGEELRIGIRYLIKEADLMGTLADLSSLADVYLQTAFSLACEELGRKSGTGVALPSDFAVIGLGKLGGNELNFGSDLDIFFVYEEPEETAAPPQGVVPYYASLSQLIYRLTSEMTPAGFAYKIDTDLRPEGSGGVLVLSLQGYREYFQSRARIWEQQAMTRARFVAGKPELGEKFLEVAHEFTYRPKLEYGSLIEISRLRERMEKELAHEATKGKNIKLGYGGLADIEFAMQILQLMHGGRHPRLRATNTLEVLKLFAEYGMVEQDAAVRLRENYLFLRNLECGMRIVKQPFSSHLPRDDESLAALARLLEFRESDPSTLAAKLRREYDKNTKEVRKFYRKMVGSLLRTSL